MDQTVKRPEDQFLPALADALKEWFPDVGPRASAVSEISISKENIPTLPLILVAFIKSESEQARESYSEEFRMTDTFTVELWMPPNRIKRPDNSETPFWSYYPYEEIRDIMISNTTRWIGPGGKRASFRSLTIEADQFAVVMSFIFTTTFRWCASYNESGDPFSIGFNLCTPKACIPDPDCFGEEALDPCHPCP
ncbi:hypothetical protein ABIF78_007723 [Bradyrhizobium japonicum]